MKNRWTKHEFGLVLKALEKFPSDHSVNARRTAASALTGFMQLAYRHRLSILELRIYNREASSMRIHLQSAHVVAIIAIALFTALMLAVRFRTTNWRGIVLEALIANIGAIAAVVAFEVVTS